VPAGNTGARELPLWDGTNGPGTPVMYEPWRPFVGGSVLGYGNVLSVNTPDAATVCRDALCGSVVATTGKGATRFLSVLADFGVQARLAGATGVFRTNAFGTAVQASGVRQYVRADADARWAYMGDTSACGVRGDRFAAVLVCTPDADRGSPLELEGALAMPN